MAVRSTRIDRANSLFDCVKNRGEIEVDKSLAVFVTLGSICRTDLSKPDDKPLLAIEPWRKYAISAGLSGFR
jgi:hypothetical protein